MTLKGTRRRNPCQRPNLKKKLKKKFQFDFNGNGFKSGKYWHFILADIGTLESGIDVGQGINVGPGKFVKKYNHRALNKRRA